jgi:Cu-processing system permease protein
MTLALRQIATIAGKEFRDRLRNRWVWAIVLVFAGFALAIAYFGAAGEGQVGFRGIEVTIASLVSLVTYLIPLIALVLGFDAVVGERERGTLELLLALPVTRAEVLLGKFCGLAATLAVATALGFGLAGIAFVGDGGPALFDYAGFVLSAILLGFAFLAIAVLLSVLAPDRASASGYAVGAWFLFVIVFDLVLLGGLIAFGGASAGEALPWLLLANPTDVFRVLNVFSLEQVSTLYGLATVLPPALADTATLGGVMVAWIAAPLALAYWRFK